MPKNQATNQLILDLFWNYILFMTLNSLRDLGNVMYPYIAIASKSILTRSGCTWVLSMNQIELFDI